MGKTKVKIIIGMFISIIEVSEVNKNVNI